MNEEDRRKIIDAMCMTERHDFGLEKLPGSHTLSCGMTELEREELRRRMAQLFDHHVFPAYLAGLRRAAHIVSATHWKPAVRSVLKKTGRRDSCRGRYQYRNYMMLFLFFLFILLMNFIK